MFTADGAVNREGTLKLAMAAVAMVGLIGGAAFAQAPAVAELLARPVEQRASAEFHAALARALHAAGQVDPAADAAVTARLAAAKERPADLVMLAPELSREAAARYDAAMVALDAGDLKSAVKGYLTAVKRDPAILGRDDRGLRRVALTALERAVAKEPTARPARWRLGLYAYLFGELESARTALQPLAGGGDFLQNWKVQMLADRVNAELAYARHADARAAAAAAPSVVDLPRSDAAPAAPSGPSPERLALEAELAQVSTDLSYYSSGRYKYEYDEKGRVREYSPSNPVIVAKVEALTARKGDLERQLWNTK